MKMGLNRIMETYRVMEEGTEFLLECKEKGATRADLESGKYPELSEKFQAMGKKGRETDVNHLEFMIAYMIHLLRNNDKINEAHEYACQYIHVCSINTEK